MLHCSLRQYFAQFEAGGTFDYTYSNNHDVRVNITRSFFQDNYRLPPNTTDGVAYLNKTWLTVNFANSHQHRAVRVFLTLGRLVEKATPARLRVLLDSLARQ